MVTKRRKGSGKSKGKKKFQYKAPSRDAMNKRATQSGGNFDSYMTDAYPQYKVQDGENCIRLLPPTFDEATHYGMDIYVHYDIGPNKDTYLCAEKMGRGKCPICDEAKRAAREGEDREYIQKLGRQNKAKY